MRLGFKPQPDFRSLGGGLNPCRTVGLCEDMTAEPLSKILPFFSEIDNDKIEKKPIHIG
ncbi:hypothetical protein [Microcoleus sp. herbarium12]|uniref:hypothetical protein n=1 Tax=Microcoleus sp. herbarium12 TaxID=3055437 RepID=UPI002FD4E1AE